MDTASPTLTEFILARIVERQAKAQAVIDSHEMWGWGSYTASAGMYQEPVSEFAEIVSPEWVIAECEATQRTVQHCADDLTNKHRDVYVLEFLALPYADHPDYDEAWRP